MKWIRTGLQIGQAVKNVQRLRQILSVFAKHGFVDVLERMGLSRFVPKRFTTFINSEGDATAMTAPERLKSAFEELGPTFVKLGQLLSTRSDLLPERYIEEFTKLQDNVAPMAFEIVRETVELELKKPLSDVFTEFSETPLAAASIGQVHVARLVTGEDVVVKVQRPEVERLIHNDIGLLAFLAGLLERYVPETRLIGPKTIVDEFFRVLSYELDYVVEASNTEKIAANLKEFPGIVVPKVYKNWSTHKVLVEEKIDGIRVNDLAALDRAGIDRKVIVELGAKSFFKSVMVDGLFHGDLHGGNLFVLPGNRLGLIDFGIVGRLSEKSRGQLANMVISLVEEDFENLCYEYAELGVSGGSIDFEGFQREVRNVLSPYMGLSLGELNVGKVLIEATKIATKYQIKIPGDWMIVFKAILTMEGMGRTLDPNFDLIASGESLIKDLVKHRYSPEKISRDLFWMSRDVVALLQVLPRQLRWMFKKFNSNDFAFEIKVPDLDQLSKQMDRNAKSMSLSVFGAGFLISGAIALNHPDPRTVLGYPLFAVVLLVVGFLLLLRSWWKS